MENFYIKSHVPFLKVDKTYYSKINNIHAITIFSLICERMGGSINNKKFKDENDKSYVIFTNKELESKLRCSRKTCYNAIKFLEDKNLIKVIRKPRFSNRYYIDMDLYNQNVQSKSYYKVTKEKFEFLKINLNKPYYYDSYKHKHEPGLENLNQVYIMSYLEDLMRLSLTKDNEYSDNDRYYVILNQSKMESDLHISKHTIQKNLARLEILEVPENFKNALNHFIERKRQKYNMSKLYLPSMSIDETQVTIRNATLKNNIHK